MSERPLIIIGASARAAAEWAIARGYTPWCIDLFADCDLQAIAPVTRCAMERYPEGLVQLMEDAPHGPVLLTGRMENHLDIVETVAARRPLLHSSVAAMRKAREIALLSGDGPQVVKSRRGGRPRRYRGEPLGEHEYLQPFIEGRSLSAVYDGDRCIGATIQLVEQFRYVGSVGPIEVTQAMRELGRRFAGSCGLTGLWGIDMIEDPAGRLHPVQINPRFTASVEVFERNRSKLIVFAKCDLIAPDMYTLFDRDEVADVPIAGTAIRRGEPVCTVFAAGITSGGTSGAECRLYALAERIYTHVAV